MGPGGPGGPSGQKNFNENRDNIAAGNRDKFYADEYAARNRMGSMNAGNPSHDDGMANNRGGGAGGAGGVAWLSQQNNQNELPNANDKFKMHDKPSKPANMEGSSAVTWLSSQNKKKQNEDEDNVSSKQDPAIVWPSRTQNRENDMNSEYNAKGAHGGSRGKYDSRVEDDQSQKYGRDPQGAEEYNTYWPST